jgi:serine protease AprX
MKIIFMPGHVPLLVACLLAAPLLQGQFAQTENIDNYVIFHNPGEERRLVMLPSDSIRSQPGLQPLPHLEEETLAERTHPKVRDWLARGRQEDAVALLVTMRDDKLRPVLPQYREDLLPDAVANVAIERSRLMRMQAFAKVRADAHDAKLRALGADRFIRKESFTAANAMYVETTIGSIARLLADPDVVHIEPAFQSAPPPALPTVANGRAMMQTDFWITQFAKPIGPFPGFRAKTWLRLGLLDTGVRPTHALLNGRIAVARDCYNGTDFSQCVSGPNVDPIDHDGHGTASAAIISGTASLGNDFQGVGFYYIDSFKVSTPQGFDELMATLRAFAAAESVGDKVILPEVQFDASTNSGLAQAADIAFQQYGIAVIAPIGNGTSGGFPTNAARSPGSARNVLGVGAVDIASGQHIISFSQGPTPDGRIKPDIQAPTGANTASAASDSAITLTPFNGTSCAGAFAAGMALVLWNINNDTWGTMNDQAGLSYSDALCDGSQPGPFYDNVDGAGLVRESGNWCENGGGMAKGEVTFGPTQNFFDVNLYQLDLGAFSSWDPVTHTGDHCPNNNQIDAAAWWSESAENAHLQINLFLVNGTGQVVGVGNDPHSVWQKLRYRHSPLGSGDWHLRLVSTTIPDHEVRCYYSIRAGLQP